MQIHRTGKWGAAPFLLFAVTLWWFAPSRVHANVSNTVRGMIVLEVERNGEAWYIDPMSLHRVFLGRPQDAWEIMRQHGLGISNADLAKIPPAGSSASGDYALRQRLAGRIVLQVERNGEAWYVYPKDLKRYYLGRPYDAFQVMTRLGLGITEQDLYQIISERNLPVPFTAQAPYGVWDFDHDNFCEEASSLMVARYVRNQGINGPADADSAMYALKDWEVATLGYHKDTGADDTARMMRENYNLTVTVIDNPTATSIRQQLDLGHVFVAPVAGTLLGNPYFSGLGPPYHMFVIKGYTNDGWFITNEPGTRHGADYTYRQSTVMNALHDYNGGNTLNGPRRILEISP